MSLTRETILNGLARAKLHTNQRLVVAHSEQFFRPGGVVKPTIPTLTSQLCYQSVAFVLQHSLCADLDFIAHHDSCFSRVFPKRKS